MLLKRYTIFLFLVVMVIALTTSGCGNDLGKRLIINGMELYYTSAVTESEAKKLGDYLLKENFANGRMKTVQLNKKSGTYEFRMVVKKGIEQDQDIIAGLKLFAAQLSKAVFNNAKVDIHLCDEDMKTIRVVVVI